MKSRSRYTGINKAKKTKVHGIEYDSKLEADVAGLLKMFKVPHLYNQEVFVLLDKMTLEVPYIEKKKTSKNKAIRTASYKIDFSSDKFLCETKGFPTELWKLRWKLLLHRLKEAGDTRPIYLVRNVSEAKSMIADLLEKK